MIIKIQMKEILCGHGIKLNCEQFQTILLLFTFLHWKNLLLQKKFIL